METIELDGEGLTLDTIQRFLREPETPIVLARGARERVRESQRVVEAVLASDRAVYGVTTGFGRLADVRIAPDRVRELQGNLILSHCAGVGDPLPPTEVKLMALLRVNTLAKGLSGVRVETVEALCELVNRGVIPVIPEKGSVGASGDLAPLAHLAAVLCGEGEAFFEGGRLPAARALEKAGLAAYELGAKEGLSLINGTQFMTALGAKAAVETGDLCRHADIAAALSIDALMGTDVAFDARIAGVRPHPGAAKVARNLRGLLGGSEIRESHRGPHCRKVQDPYSMRCVPQVHGAVRDALDHVAAVIEREMNAGTDNPLVFAAEGEILSGGNFHGAPVALALDYLAMAVAELGSIGERRIDRLVDPDKSGGLPPFLTGTGTEGAGLHSGFMMAQVTAAALASECKVLAHPASVDSIPTGAGNEDHVSMGAHAARKLREVIRNVESIVAIELLVGLQAVEARAPLRTGFPLRAAQAAARHHVPSLGRDRPLTPDIHQMVLLMRDGELLDAVRAELEELA